MPLTDEPRPELIEATLAIMSALQPWIPAEDTKQWRDIPAVLSALATVMSLVSAGRAFLASDDEKKQLARITSDEADIIKSFTIAARHHLAALRGKMPPDWGG